MRANTSRLGSLLRPASRDVPPSLNEDDIRPTKLSSRASPAISTSQISPIPSTASALAHPESQPLAVHSSIQDSNTSSRSPLNLSKNAIHDRLLTDQSLQPGASTHPASGLLHAQQVETYIKLLSLELIELDKFDLVFCYCII